MFVILVQRAIRVAQSPQGDKFAARSTTHMSWGLIGPFDRPGDADAALVAISGNRSVIAAERHDRDSLLRAQRDRWSNELVETRARAFQLLGCDRYGAPLTEEAAV